ncbi:MAG: hypothetical protein LBM98_05700 [Oscillospiraceae bacterium]|jgi:hypothetical protein|nr:hypothetical protein [Oscillospiraceae bacterium]
MNLLHFLAANWDSAAIVLAVLAAAIILVVKRRFDLLQPILFALVTEAERVYGGSTGVLKLAKVVEWLLPHIPAILKPFIGKERLEGIISDALEAAKLKWAGNPALVPYETKG